MTDLARIQRRAVFGSAGKRQANSVAWLQAFERRYEQLASERAGYRSVMSRDARASFSDPRYERGTAVNATEVRGSDRWTASKGHTSEVTRIAGLPLWVTAAFDTETIARHWPGHVSVFSSDASGTESDRVTKRQARPVTVQARRAAALRAAAGTIRMGEQD